jgi:alginate O-acetyltransferase complex protein AlgI
MLFNSLSYLIFFPIVFALYWLSPQTWRRALLLLASYVFYMSWLPVYGLLLLALTAASYFLGLAIARFQSQRKALLVLGLIVNLGTLCFYKYADFFIQSLFKLAEKAHLINAASVSMPHLGVILPLGISFFAFEFIHYLTDVYKGGKPIRSPIDFGLFAAFFPSQIAGPIKRYQDFIHQLEDLKPFNSEMFHQGIALILQGLFKKVALADNLSLIVTAGFSFPGTLGTSTAWISALAFAAQIYFDFSGYTDIGRGSAMLLGFNLPDNFNYPYMAASVSDFWKRWHISLSSWLRDYLYIPLGGNRTSRVRKHVNLLITMLLGGLWHGAAWHYVIWGGLHGCALVVSHEYDRLCGRIPALQTFHARALGKLTSAALTFLVVLVAWVYFRASTVKEAAAIVKRMFVPTADASGVLGIIDQSPVMVALVVYAIYALVVILWRRAQREQWATKVPTWRPNRVSQAILYAGAFLLAIGFAPGGQQPFIYFQF